MSGTSHLMTCGCFLSNGIIPGRLLCYEAGSQGAYESIFRGIVQFQGELICSVAPDLLRQGSPWSSHTCKIISIRPSSDLQVTHIVKTIPPLRTSLASLGRAPDQNVNMPSSLKIRAAQLKLFRYSLLDSIDCIRVLIVSIGIVA